MIISFVRSILLYFSIILAMRVMGKRQLGELQPFELVVTLLLSDLAAVPMQETGIPLLQGLVPILTLVVLEISLSFFSMKSKRLRAFLIGHPVILIRGGNLVQKELRRLRITIDDIEDAVREQGMEGVDAVEMAILETDGKISAFPKAEFSPIPFALIRDGRIIGANLKKCALSRKDLEKMLGGKRPEDVFLATFTKENGLSVQEKDK